MKLFLPELPVLVPVDLMEFRDESKVELRAFRRSMLTYASSLNNALDQNSDQKEIEKHARFFVDTEIAPRLDELRETLNKRSFGWITRSAYKMVPAVGAGYLTGGGIGAIAALLTSGVAHVPTEFKSSSGATNEAKKSGLYYLLKAETKISERRPGSV